LSQLDDLPFERNFAPNQRSSPYILIPGLIGTEAPDYVQVIDPLFVELAVLDPAKIPQFSLSPDQLVNCSAGGQEPAFWGAQYSNYHDFDHSPDPRELIQYWRAPFLDEGGIPAESKLIVAFGPPLRLIDAVPSAFFLLGCVRRSDALCEQALQAGADVAWQPLKETRDLISRRTEYLARRSAQKR
jgi:hypothetical protein